MKVSWDIIAGVETQIWRGDTPSASAILFCPGFPGLGAALFEQRHAAALVDEGYDVYVFRHTGMKTTGAMAPAVINNASRLQKAWADGDTHLGGAKANAAAMMMEPYRVLNDIADSYDTIHVLGNSFGALASLWSLTEVGAKTDKVKSLILLAGAQGVDDGSETCVMRLWNPVFMTMPRITDQLELDDVGAAIEAIKKVYGELPARVTAMLPSHIGLTYVVVAQDELLYLPDTLAFQAAIGGRGKVVMDTADRAYPDYAMMAHYMPDYKTGDLLQLIRG